MQKTIFVTGASTGIGFDCVRALLVEDFQVVATVRTEEDKRRLKNTFAEGLHVLIVDISNYAQVDKIPAQLDQLGIKHLAGLVNNAGVALAAPFLYQDFAEIQQIINVNVLSLMKVTQVLLPLLGTDPSVEKPGRIVNMSSVAGKSAAPFLSLYAASKHAVEGFSEGLRRELMLFGIKVIVIGPGSIKTPIWQKGFVQVKEKYNYTPYAHSFKKFMSIALGEEKNALEVTEVSKLVVAAFKSAEPKLRYAPIPRKWINWYFPMLIPAKMYNRLTAKVLGLKIK
ncbi:MAG: SDR family NAD(P)-dependent oxidoreductase [Bdellovibrio sp.]|nr:SDR family NAD(P)-dependent oxidoreductase [Bdellovibrio sp.]